MDVLILVGSIVAIVVLIRIFSPSKEQAIADKITFEENKKRRKFDHIGSLVIERLWLMFNL